MIKWEWMKDEDNRGGAACAVVMFMLLFGILGVGMPLDVIVGAPPVVFVPAMIATWLSAAPICLIFRHLSIWTGLGSCQIDALEAYLALPDSVKSNLPANMTQVIRNANSSEAYDIEVALDSLKAEYGRHNSSQARIVIDQINAERKALTG